VTGCTRMHVLLYMVGHSLVCVVVHVRVVVTVMAFK